MRKLYSSHVLFEKNLSEKMNELENTVYTLLYEPSHEKTHNVF